MHRHRVGLTVIAAMTALGGAGPGLAQPSPAVMFGLGVSEDVVLAGATVAFPIGGKALTYGVKGMNFAIAVGDAGVSAQDRTLGRELAMAGELGELLKAMHDNGINTATDWRAVQVKAKLKALQTSMSSGEEGLGYAAYAVGRNTRYAFGRAGFDFALGETIGYGFKKLGFDKDAAGLGPGAWIRRRFGGGKQPRYTQIFKYEAWAELEDRAIKGQKYADEMSAAMAQSIIERSVTQSLQGLEDNVRANLLEMVRKDHPSGRQYRPLRIEIARAVLPAAPVAAARAVEPQIFISPIVAARAVEFTAPQARYPMAAADPVARVVQAEDRWRDNSYVPQVRTLEPTPLPPPPPPAPPEPTARELQRRHDWSCAGAGVKAGCDWPPGNSSSWDGNNRGLRE